jgi:2-polyprenyl-6-methoxyphenol hydroxylase-like FAD-dependent oxidoreductase
MSERILIAGAGIAGLSAAMALAGPGRDVTVIDRDPPPPDLGPEEAFEAWERKGVTQLRHSHVFIGRLIKLIRERHPGLWTSLLAAGAREFTFEDGLPPALRGQYRREAGDEDLSFLFSRRTTLELTMRRYAATLPGVRFLTSAGIRGVTRAGDRVTGLSVEIGGVLQEIAADSIVDASGRGTQFPEWLGLTETIIDTSPAGILYFTRHYKLLDGAEEPPRDGPPGAGDLGYIKFGLFPADNRHFSVTLAVPEIETGLRTAILNPETFDAICRAIPGTARWIDTSRAEPASKVFGMGNLHNIWRSYAPGGVPHVLGYYPIGDAALRTNPLYGRGCSTSAIQAHLLADIFAETREPAERLVALETRTRDELRPFYEVMTKQDAQAIKRAALEQAPGYRPRFKARVMKSFIEDAVGPATRSNLAVLRAVMRPFHMLEHPTAWTRRAPIMARVLKSWATPKALKRRYYLPSLGPERAEMLQALGLAA